MMEPGRCRALADCQEHGLLMIDLRLEKDEKGNTRVKRSAMVSDVQSTAYVKTKHLQWANKVAASRQKEASA